jgi:hypothetical protein
MDVAGEETRGGRSRGEACCVMESRRTVGNGRGEDDDDDEGNGDLAVAGGYDEE